MASHVDFTLIHRELRSVNILWRSYIPKDIIADINLVVLLLKAPHKAVLMEILFYLRQDRIGPSLKSNS